MDIKRVEFAKSLDAAFGDESKSLRNRAKWAAAARRQVGAVLRVIDRLPSAGDIESARADVPWYRGSDTPVGTVFFALRADRPDSAILREIVGALHVKITKTPHYSGQGLDATFDVGDIRFEFSGYRPATCKVVETVGETRVDDVVIRDGVVYRVGVKRRVVCSDTQTAEGEGEGADA